MQLDEEAQLKALYTEPSKSQYSISPLVLVIFKSPTPTVVPKPQYVCSEMKW